MSMQDNSGRQCTAPQSDIVSSSSIVRKTDRQRESLLIDASRLSIDLHSANPMGRPLVPNVGPPQAGATSTREPPLSSRERTVLALISRGMCNKRIARELDIAPETVKSHAKRILTKLRAKTRAEAVALLYQQ
jgi:DNA-binding CsgD family transcriptional regulator